ncbi:MAG: protein kinase [Myxococcota bacterium]
MAFPQPFGRYVLEKSLSRGGMGDVFLAIARGVNQRCVIKTIRTDLDGDSEFVGRFTDEAKIMVRMQHENIIRVFDCGKFRETYYIAMEYVPGFDLGDVLDRAYERGQPLPLPIGLYIAEMVLAGLDHVHNLADEHGRHMALVHRDVSPQNILVGGDGAIRLIDFGLARSALLPSRTVGALAVGKFGYMSPEQARHETIDGRADLYATGVMLFEVFTGERLVDETDQKTLWKRVLEPQHRSPRSVVPALPTSVDGLLATATATDPDERFPTALAMRDAVRSIQREVGSQHTGRDMLVEHLKTLYPLTQGLPPMPELPEMTDDISLIIATSREKQRSVFGRGELPVERTMSMDIAVRPRGGSGLERGTWTDFEEPTVISRQLPTEPPTEREGPPPLPKSGPSPQTGPQPVAPSGHPPAPRSGRIIRERRAEPTPIQVPKTSRAAEPQRPEGISPFVAALVGAALGFTIYGIWWVMS